MFNKVVMTKPRALMLTGLMAGSVMTYGCASRGGILGVDCCADIPAGAIPETAGTRTCEWQNAQVANAIADQTVLYQADFIGESSTLSPGAIDRMARNANSGLADLQPSLIEPSGNPSLDAERVNVVNIQLASFGVDAPFVEVATPAAIGLRGPRAEAVARGAASTRNSRGGTGASTSQSFGAGGLTGSFGGSGSGSGSSLGGIF